VIFCPLHGGSFNVRSGKACSLPCKQKLRTYPVQIADGAIWMTP
jgi:nitrite reductase/ring-hydroxylating ferredoxin subunit